MKKLTLGILAHVDSGKTTLSEALLYLCGSLRKFGRVDKGASFLDNDSLERQRGITIFSKQARFEYGNTSFVLIDTPGHADFSAETERTLQVLDCCILVVSAKDGIKGQTKVLWNLLEEYRIPVFLFVNKMDQEGADKDDMLACLKKLTENRVADFSGIRLTEEGLPEKGPDRFSPETLEEIATGSEEAMEEYLETGILTDERIRGLIGGRLLFPCFFGSALHQTGIYPLLFCLDLYAAPPAWPDSFSARAYKISRDSDGTRLTFMKITGGSLKARSLFPDGNEESRIHQIRLYSGDRYETADSVSAGEICAVTGLKESFAGQIYGAEKSSPHTCLSPVLSYRVIPPEGVDAVAILPSFRILEEESPELSVTWEENTKEIHIHVMGRVQLEILTALLKERFGLEVSFDSGEVVYLETIASPVTGVGHFEPLRHYAEVHLLMEPLPAGSGLVFDSAVSTDLLAKNWQRLILTHLKERRHKGILTGAFITDMKITVTAGKAHLKHTEGGDFRQAVYRAVRQGLMMAENILLEPYYRFVLEIPSENTGKALTDLDRMGAEFSAPEPDAQKGTSVISGRGPVAALKDYPAEIAAFTKGRGSIGFTSGGYGPCHNAEEIILKKGYDPCADLRNTPDSVFCRNGSSIIVPYDQVYDWMHLDSSGSANLPEPACASASRVVSGTPLGTEEVDEIIARITGSNAGKKSSGYKRKVAFASANPRAGTAASKASGAVVFTPEEADQVLADGYNIIFAWEDLSSLAGQNLQAARDALISILSKYRSMTGAEVTVVFDAYRIKGPAREHGKAEDIRIVYTKEDETADQYIERFANENAGKKKVTVVTSDFTEQIVAGAQGCRLISSRQFRLLIEQLTEQWNRKYGIQSDSLK